MQTYDWEWWMIFLFSIIPYAPLYVGAILNSKDKSHNFLVWFLYLCLDSITFFTGMMERENPDPMVLGFGIGSILMASIMVYQKRFVNFGRPERIATALTLIGFSLWITSGPQTAFIFSIFSEIVVGGYLIYKTFKNPTMDYNFWAYLLFLFVSSFSVITTDKWTIYEVGYATSETILNIIIIIPLLPFRFPWLKTKLRILKYKKRRKNIRLGFTP